MTKSPRLLNGYRVLYIPEHPKAMKNKCWNGYVYEHILVAEKELGREIRESEVVHHLDENKSNNRYANLLVLEKSQHGKLHAWLNHLQNNDNACVTKPQESKFCLVCGATLQDKQLSTCSAECRILNQRKKERPSIQVLEKDLSALSFRQVGKKYGVSDNTIRNWIQKSLVAAGKD